MTNKTITFKCDECGQKLTFYRDSFAYDGCCCPICDRLGMKPILTKTSFVLFGKREVLKTRELFKKANKGRPTVTIEEALNS